MSSLLWDAVESENLYFLKRLLAQGWNPDDPDQVGQTASDVAISRDSPDILAALLDAGGKCHFWGDSDGFPDLAAVAGEGKVAVARYLLSQGYDPGRQGNRSGSGTALHEALAGIGEELIPLLLAYGADPEVRDASGKSPRELAVEAGRFDALEKMDYARDGEMLAAWHRGGRNIDAQEALGAAIVRGDRVVQDALLGKCAWDKPVKGMGTALLWSAYAGNVELLDNILAMDPDPFNGDPWGRNALWVAARYGREAVVDRILAANTAAGWSLPLWGTCSWDGSTALWNAAEQGHDNVVEMLLDAGAVDVLNTRRKEGAVSAAARGGWTGVLTELLGRGASAEGLKGEIRPPIYTARLSAEPASYQLLKKFGAVCDRPLSLRYEGLPEEGVLARTA